MKKIFLFHFLFIFLLYIKAINKTHTIFKGGYRMKAIKNRLGKVLIVTTIAVSLLATSFAFADTKPVPKVTEGPPPAFSSRRGGRPRCQIAC